MNLYTLQQLLVMLGTYERGHEQFGQFLGTSDRYISRLWQFLAPLKGKFTADSITDRKLAFAAIFGKNKAYRAAPINALLNQVRNQLECFVYVLEVSNTANGQLLLAKLHQRHGYTDLAKATHNNALLLGKHEDATVRYFVDFEVYKERYFDDGKAGFTESKQGLSFFNAINYLRLVIRKLMALRGGEKEIDESLVKEIGQFIEGLPEGKPPILISQIKAVKYYLSPSKEKYNSFKNNYFENFQSLGIEKEALFICLVNCIIVCPKSDENLRQDYLFLYRHAIEHELYAAVSVWSFCNLIFIAQALNDYDLVDLAIKKLVPLIPDQTDQYRCEYLANAYVFFGAQNFSAALENIEKLDATNSSKAEIGLRKNVLKLKCLYETAEHINDARYYIRGQRTTFRNMLDRYVLAEKINTYQRAHAVNFYNLLRSIVSQKKSKTELMEELESYEGELMETKWLKDKITELS